MSDCWWSGYRRCDCTMSNCKRIDCRWGNCRRSKLWRSDCRSSDCSSCDWRTADHRIRDGRKSTRDNAGWSVVALTPLCTQLPETTGWPTLPCSAACHNANVASMGTCWMIVKKVRAMEERWKCSCAVFCASVVVKKTSGRNISEFCF